MSADDDLPTIQVRLDGDGYWTWRVLHPTDLDYDGQRMVVAECMEQIGHDMRHHRREVAVHNARRAAKAWDRQRKAKWEDVPYDG